MRPFQHQLPNKGNYVDLTLHDVMDITAQLDNLLRAESELLGAMRVKEIGPLQAEKQKLSEKLERFKNQLVQDDSVVKTAADADREQMLVMTDNLAVTIEENMRRTVIAQNVNQRVMRTLMEIMVEKQRTGAYSSQGQISTGQDTALAINLNERA